MRRFLSFTIMAMFVLSLSMVSAVSAQASTLTIGRGTDVRSLDPPDITSNDSGAIVDHIYEGLVTYDDHLNIKPSLATSWSTSEDGKTWTFELKKGVKFHSGTEFDANAVKKTFERTLQGNFKRSSLYKPIIEDIKVLGKYRIQFITKMPYAPFLPSLCHTAGLIIDPDYIDKKVDLKRHASGTGPFVFKEWEINDHATLVANANYWRGKPKIDKVIYKTIPEDTTRSMMLETGELDVAERISPFEIERLKKNKDLTVLTSPSLRVIYLGCNTSKPFLEDVRVRRAVAHAINRDAICSKILKGTAAPISGIVSPATNAYVKFSKNFDYNPKKSKQLLSEAGWKDSDGDGIVEKSGAKLQLKLYTSNGREPMDYKVAEAVDSYLKAVGIQSKLQALDWGTYISVRRQPKEKSETELFLGGWAPSTGDADWVYRPLFETSMIVPKGQNFFFFSNPALDKDIEKGMTSLDKDKRAAAYAAADEIIFDQVPAIPLYVLKNVVGYRNRVKGLVQIPIEYVNYKSAWIK